MFNAKNEIMGDWYEDIEGEREEAYRDQPVDDRPPHADAREPEPGTYAYTARFLANAGLMSGDEADAWKDEMKERDLDEYFG